MSRAVILFLMSASIACGPRLGPGQTGAAQGGAGVTVNQAVQPRDQAFEVQLAVDGTVHMPAELIAPSMPQMRGKRPANLTAVRARASRPSRSARDVHALAAALWEEADQQPPDNRDAARALRSEALTALRDLHTEQQDSPDPMTIEMLAVAEASTGDPDVATRLFGQLMTNFAGGDRAGQHRLWLCLGFLRSGKRDQAKAALEAADQAGDAHPAMVAYLRAWYAWISGDEASARKEILGAVAEQAKDGKWRRLGRDVSFFLTRGGADIAAAEEAYGKLAETRDLDRSRWFQRLSEGYRRAGDYAHASDALDHLIDTAATHGLEVTGELRVGLRFRQADYAFRLNQPTRAAEFAIEAHRALPSCGPACEEQVAGEVAGRLSKLAQYFHTVFAATQDLRHYEAARTLYDYYLEQPTVADLEAIRVLRSNLDDTKNNVSPENAEHTDEVIASLIKARVETVKGCYEAELSRQPELEGALSVTIAIRNDGTVEGGSTEPHRGLEGMARVAGCTLDRAVEWSFPSRAVPGVTTVAITYSLTPTQAEQRPRRERSRANR